MASPIAYQSIVDIALPVALRPVAPFLEEAQAIVRNCAVDDVQKKNVATYCIDHAFHLVEKFELSFGKLLLLFFIHAFNFLFNIYRRRK
jgi:hypothetical protein